MILKSYLVENNIDILEKRLVLFYGENIGLIEDIKHLIINKHNKSEILRFTQDDILKDIKNFENEITNISLFEQNKVFFINDVNDKILNVISEINIENKSLSFFLFAKILDKKSKLRNFFEKSTKADVVGCYQDNEISLKKIIIKKLQGYKGITQEIINNMIDNCSNDRAKLNNELDKIKCYFINKTININEINKLINFKQNDDFDIIKNSALCGQKKNTNKLLSSTIIETDKTTLYLSILNQRFYKLKEIFKSKTSLEISINEIKPPIFWKEKPVFLQQVKLWNESKINAALKKIYDTELKSKMNSSIDKKTLLKSLIIDICELANAA